MSLSDAYLAKARVLFDAANANGRDDPSFPFWSSIFVEMILRAAYSKVSPILLADPASYDNLLQSAGIVATTDFKSVNTSVLLRHLQKVVPTLDNDDLSALSTLILQRNEFLHTERNPFEALYADEWINGFYRAVPKIAQHLGVDLETLLGEADAAAATEASKRHRREVDDRVKNYISLHRDRFEQKSKEQKEAAIKDGTPAHLAYLTKDGVYGRRQTCPACKNFGFLLGRVRGDLKTRLSGTQIVKDQLVQSMIFACKICELKVEGVAEIEAAKLPTQYSHEEDVDPVEYFDIDVLQYAKDNLWDDVYREVSDEMRHENEYMDE